MIPPLIITPKPPRPLPRLRRPADVREVDATTPWNIASALAAHALSVVEVTEIKAEYDDIVNPPLPVSRRAPTPLVLEDDDENDETGELEPGLDEQKPKTP